MKIEKCAKPKESDIKYIYYPGGNGCLRHPDCFSCPQKDCTWND